MKTYTNCQTRHTGLYKPHTIYIDNVGISIVYYDKDCTKEKTLIAIASDDHNNKYEIFETISAYGNKGYLAFPISPEKIKGFYPYL